MAASTVQEKSLPNVAVFTFEGVRANSLRFPPVRELSLWYVNAPARSVTPIVADAVLVVSAELRAVTVCTPGVIDGVYLPVPSIVPTVELPLAMESTSQVTLVLVLPVTVGVNCCACVVVTAARFGRMETATVGAVVVALAIPE